MVRRAGRLSGLKMRAGERLKRVGFVGVDSGQVVITDPSYIGDKGFPSYEKISSTTIKKIVGQLPIGKSSVVVSSSGLGDGNYPVYAVLGKADMLGDRVKALVVDFEVEKGIPLMKKLLKRGDN